MSLRRHLRAEAREALESLSQNGSSQSRRVLPNRRVSLPIALSSVPPAPRTPLSLYAVIVVSMRACPGRLMLFYPNDWRRAGARCGSVIR